MEYRAFYLRRVFRLAWIVFLLSFTRPIFGQTSVTFNGRPAVGGEILIRLRSTAPQALARVRSANPFALIETLSPDLSLHLVDAPGRNIDAMLRAFSNQSDVLYAEPNYIMQSVSTTPNDVSFNILWAMTQIGAPSAWDITTGGTSVVVGVVDTGMDYTHADLAANVWSAPSAFTVTVQGREVICPAGAHGFNALNNTCDPADDNNHGTHTSGILGAVGNNSIGVSGVNWRTKIMGLKFMDASGAGPLSAAINAIEFAIQVKSLFAGTSTPVDVRVLSNSWGANGFSQGLMDEVTKANAYDMLFVAAAGNSSSNNDLSPFYPANFSTSIPNVISVAATDGGDNLAGFSDYGLQSVQLGAPGVAIYSTFPGGGYAMLDGTSMATPHVAGAATLVLSACPSLSTAALKNALLSNVDLRASLSGKTATGGRLNVSRAVRSCAPGVPAPLKATFLGPTGQDLVGPSGALQPDGVVDWHIRMEGLRAVPVKVRVTSRDGGVWEVPSNGTNWLVATRFPGDGTGDLWFQPWSNPSAFHVTLWYSDSTTDDVDAGLQVVSTLTGTYLGVTGQDFVSGPFLQPNGIADWHIHLQGLRGIPARLRITSTSGGIWESPFNGTNWIVATQYAANGAGDLWFDPFSANTSFHVKVWYSDGAVDETDVGTFDFPSTLKATYLGITGEDFVGSNGSLAANGNPDWHIQLQGLRATPTKVRVTADPIGTWEAPFNGTNWLVATQYETGGAGGLWFEPYVTPTRFHVTVWYADGTTDEIDAL